MNLVSKLCALVVIFGLGTASASMKEDQTFKKWNEFLNDAGKSYLGSVDKKCGKVIPVTIEKNMVTPFMEKNKDASSFCDKTRSVISGMCADATAKEAVTKQIDKVACKMSEKGKEVSMTLSGKTLQVMLSPDDTNLEGKIKAFLEKTL